MILQLIPILFPNISTLFPFYERLFNQFLLIAKYFNLISLFLLKIVENKGVEPLTSWMQIKRSSQLS